MSSNKSTSAVELRHVSKTFKIFQKSNDSIRDRVMGFFTPNQSKEIKALKNINISIQKGESIGLIGRNGSGKSTLLRIILGAIKPDEGGEVKVNGRVLKLALGIGFDANLSARHNIYVNGSIMGMTFKEIGDRFHDILSFAELEEYVDTPVKYFSSGMYNRLAFAIAMYAKSDILLIDEFFGTVGDESFKNKSQKFFRDHILKDKTVIFVSHSLELVEKFCERVVYLNNGEIQAVGSSAEIVEKYLQKENEQ